ncbi:ABC transporter ATP-binding protein [Pseudanabaenaceae cyanobacterium LEGE 13415]|nr:ABC transporter ATP-binding protein [Pseudanabaenaceae cyanobacterium LEGE 13415]
MASITLDQLTKYFGQNTAVDRINLDVADGELIALLGPSGCGKTTTLRMLAGFMSPDDGQILVDGRAVSTKQRTVPPERRNMSMIFQSYAIWSHKTVFENVAFGLQLRHMSRDEIRSRVTRALEITHLHRLADRYPSQLSGGQQQRVALARAIVIEPQILLLDEPLSNLDASLRDEMRNEIRRIHDETGLTTVYVTHDQGEALVLSDRIVVMSEGRIQQAGTPEEIYETPATEFVARFIGRCNVLPGTLMRSQQVDVGGVLIAADDLAPGVSVGQDVALSVRPHSIVLDPIDCPTDDVRMNCFIASVEHQDYFGEFREYQVRIANSSVRLSVVTSPNVRHRVGDEMYLSIPKEHCRVVPITTRATERSHQFAMTA